MPSNEIIIKQHTRILTPTEYEKLRSAIIASTRSEDAPETQQLPYYAVLCDALLLSGMRPVEFSRFKPDWYKASRRVIKLPAEACMKAKCKYKERTVMLSIPGCDAFDRLTTLKYPRKGKEYFAWQIIPCRISMREALIRYAALAGIGTEGITPKMFRKTLVSWLMACYPERSIYIQASMGHTADIIANNYIGLGFTKEEKGSMKKEYLYGIFDGE